MPVCIVFDVNPARKKTKQTQPLIPCELKRSVRGESAKQNYTIAKKKTVSTRFFSLFQVCFSIKCIVLLDRARANAIYGRTSPYISIVELRSLNLKVVYLKMWTVFLSESFSFSSMFNRDHSWEKTFDRAKLITKIYVCVLYLCIW